MPQDNFFPADLDPDLRKKFLVGREDASTRYYLIQKNAKEPRYCLSLFIQDYEDTAKIVNYDIYFHHNKLDSSQGPVSILIGWFPQKPDNVITILEAVAMLQDFSKNNSPKSSFDFDIVLSRAMRSSIPYVPDLIYIQKKPEELSQYTQCYLRYFQPKPVATSKGSSLEENKRYSSPN